MSMTCKIINKSDLNSNFIANHDSIAFTDNLLLSHH